MKKSSIQIETFESRHAEILYRISQQRNLNYIDILISIKKLQSSTLMIKEFCKQNKTHINNKINIENNIKQINPNLL
jgi:hypothetical protein